MFNLDSQIVDTLEREEKLETKDIPNEREIQNNVQFTPDVFSVLTDDPQERLRLFDEATRELRPFKPVR